MCACRLLFFARRNIRQIIQILIKNDFIYGGKQSHGGRVRDCSEIPPPYVFLCSFDLQKYANVLHAQKSQ